MEDIKKKNMEQEIVEINEENVKIGENGKFKGVGDKEDELLTMPMIPLRGLSVFPGMVLHFDVGREKSISALEKAMMDNQLVFLTAQKDPDVDLPMIGDLFGMGVVSKVKQMLKLPGDLVRVLVEGLYRATLEEVTFEVPYFEVKVREVFEQHPRIDEPYVEALIRVTLDNFENYLALSQKLSSDMMPDAASFDDASRLADALIAHLDIGVEEKQEVLEALNIVERFDKINHILTKENEILKIENDINRSVKEQINKNQREFYLHEQLKAINEELGISEDIENETVKWIERLDKLKLDKKVDEKIRKELKRLERMQPASAESTVVRTYIETVIDLPWRNSSKTNSDIKKAEKILNEDHYGLEKVKERILEYLSVVKLSKKLNGPIICLVGPPGVGKTSIAKSIARATGREFVRMSLGGVRDEAEIRGHRRTYVGAIPGRIISAINDVGTNNPVFLFDEVDKLGSDFKGDPASALLEVLDLEQNKDFTDHYLEVPFDLSKVMFITTANTVDTIPGPLLDRMELIEVPGYTEEEKVKIAERYLVEKQVKAHGLKKSQVSISEPVIRDLINYYTRESGVRNLEREIANLCRKSARKIAEKSSGKVRFTQSNLEKYIGKKKYFYDKIERENQTGVVTGLAWTAVGGDTLFVETGVVPGSGKLVLTGQLGDVMQESAKTAYSYIRSKAENLGITGEFYKNKDIHIHVPEGATPKDGPSAGVTMFTSITSALLNKPVKSNVAMTGEITLRGKVLPVGGIREKVLAAHRAGINKILLPKENEKDIEEIPLNVKKKLEFVLVDKAEEVIGEALES